MYSLSSLNLPTLLEAVIDGSGEFGGHHTKLLLMHNNSHIISLSLFPWEDYLYDCARYLEFNPVRAGLVSKAWQYRWSSAAAHVEGRDDILLKAGPLLEMIGDWREYLSIESSDKDVAAFERHERTGRPLGNESFIAGLETTLELPLRLRKPGPKGSRKEKGS